MTQETNINDPSQPGFDPLEPIVLANGYTPNEKMTLPQRMADVRKSKFLDALAMTANVTHAAALVGWRPSTAYQHRKDDELFAEQWESALNEAVDAVEGEAFDLALVGEVEEKYDKEGNLVAKKFKRSEKMIDLILRRRRGEVYGDKVELNHNVESGVLVVPGIMSPDEWEKAASEQQAEHRSNTKEIV